MSELGNLQEILRRKCQDEVTLLHEKILTEVGNYMEVQLQGPYSQVCGVMRKYLEQELLLAFELCVSLRMEALGQKLIEEATKPQQETKEIIIKEPQQEKTRWRK